MTVSWCPLRERRQLSSRPSTSSDSRRSRSPRRYELRRKHSPRKESELREKVAELSKGVASIKEHFDAVQAKKDEKARRKMEREKEKEEEKRRLEEEKAMRAQVEARREAKLCKKEKKAKQEATLRAKMKKDVTVHASLLMSEIKDDWINQWKTVVLPALAGGTGDVKGKKKVVYQLAEESDSNYNSSDSETSVTPELSAETRRLCISEKRKRGKEAMPENNPSMELPPKRTPQRVGVKMDKADLRMTRAKSKRGVRTPIPAKKKTPIKTPLIKMLKSGQIKTPPSERLTPAGRALARLRYRDSIMHELKDCNADELQR
ncbi:hypothetical protein CBR_g50852 [Chara braunii]|uniref:Uncharacterized protein n=1 Tax=Chara braunii TaxID=69332 RepID=A0A388M7D7_CHABU|nr:hypothetical protein CBR_g50852 [Chara braunii]|eukprot:GBG90507.1 hypothetical protein CBR_g50852 [Chara braunii]